MKSFPLYKVHVNVESALKNVRNVLESGYINEGTYVRELEKHISNILGTDAVMMNSCTSAITTALRLCDVSFGDDVVSTPMTCVATNTPIYNAGANIVWSDIEPETGMPGPDQIEDAITERTKAVLYVAWSGNLGKLSDVYDLCMRKNIPLILDAAHSFNAKYRGLDPSQNIADFVCYSLQAIKHITSGDGGVLTSRNPDLLNKAKCLKWFGLDRDASKDENGNWRGQQWDVDIYHPGYKFNMNNLSAAVGLSQIPYVESIIDTHKRNSALYDDLFSDTEIQPLERSSEEDTARWVYTVRTPLRDEKKMRAIENLNHLGIAAGLVHVPNDNYTCFSKFKKNLPGVREFSSMQFSIPCGWWLSPDDISYIAKKTIEIIDILR